jgi:hypothetical protein
MRACWMWMLAGAVVAACTGEVPVGSGVSRNQSPLGGLGEPPQSDGSCDLSLTNCANVCLTGCPPSSGDGGAGGGDGGGIGARDGGTRPTGDAGTDAGDDGGTRPTDDAGTDAGDDGGPVR